MSEPLASALALLAHPSSPSTTGLQLHAALTPDAAGWRLHYALTGDQRSLVIPEPQPPSPADGLWQHTCFEAFVGTAGGAAYREFNFSPSGQWAAYRFSAERVRDDAADIPVPPPEIACERAANRLDLWVWLPRALLPAPEDIASSRIGLCAVIQTRDGRLSYWALHHPRAERPDFHHAGGWTHRLLSTPSSLHSPA